MNRTNSKPKIYKKLHRKFGVQWDDGIIIAYGENIHCKYKVSRHKYVHEKVHCKQQLKYGIDRWWGKYIKDKKFRLEQELEAYRKEKDYIESNIRDINLKKEMMDSILNDISSSIYGDIISYEEAKQLI